mmetsp:Transcript_25891/g.61571  ORF Transcript_25891/g.61571 Transcript_25891/m.61571 type:complete len:98 (-) Transcript_25891:353-646(-)
MKNRRMKAGHPGTLHLRLSQELPSLGDQFLQSPSAFVAFTLLSTISMWFTVRLNSLPHATRSSKVGKKPRARSVHNPSLLFIEVIQSLDPRTLPLRI